MNPQERAQILVTARLLDAAGRLDLLSTGLTLLAAAAMLFRPFAIAGVVVLVLGVFQKLYGVRVAFDAQLLRDVALGQLSDADLDAAFPSKAGRAWSDRLRGARRLVTISATATIAQCAAIVAMAMN
jgi:hypothetical protein